MGVTITALADRVQTEADAYGYLETLRWPEGTPKCPHCSNVGADFISPTNGTSRKTRTGNLSQRRVWRCRSCRKQFSVLTGTPLHGTKISVRTWVFVIFEICSSKNGVAAREIERKYGLCPRTAWFMMHRIREMMRGEPLNAERMSGVVVTDETYIGGDPQKMNHKTRAGRPFNDFSHKTPVVTMIEKHSGEARSQVMLNVTIANLAQMFKEHVEAHRSLLWTDKLPAYIQPAQAFLLHETVDHHKKQYVTKTGATTNHAEGYFSQLKRSLDGTHHHISRVHLGRYLAEHDYRYTHRTVSDTARMADLLAAMPSRRLTYSQVVAR